MSTNTYVVRINNTDGFVTRSSATMAYTHAMVVTNQAKAEAPGRQHVASWHLTEKAAREAAQSYNGRHTDYRAEAVKVEVHAGGKAKVERALKLAAEAKAADQADLDQIGKGLNAALTDPALLEQAKKSTAKKAPAKKEATPAKEAAPAAKKVATAGARAVPAEAANAERQAYVTEVGMAKYRNQYNGGWDAATAGAGVKKAASGTAPVAWMDGWTDRMANPGKAGIASKWAALRSMEAPVAKVDAPAEEAPAPAPAPAVKAPAKGTKAPAKGKGSLPTLEALTAGLAGKKAPAKGAKAAKKS